MNTLLTATHLLQWAETRASQGKLPALVRRLILASVDRQAIQRIDFPAEDSVYRPGVDGILQVVYGNAYVPAGQSVWEMGAGEDPEVKANGDYTKRASNPGQLVPSQNAFMFVTPRRWLRKNDWIATKTKENIWAGVRAYDADDLEQWLETCPAVAAWACRLIRTLPEGLCDIREMWEQWQSRTNPELSPQLLLAGRAAAVDRVRLWLANAPSCLRVRADSTDEVLGFLAAVIENENELERTRLQSRAIVVSTADLWRAIAGQQTPVILVANSPTLGSDAQAVLRGHHVLLAYGNESAGVPVDLVLPHPRRDEVEVALRAMGISEERLRFLVSEARGRVPALIDLIGGCVKAPPWAAPAVAPDLVPFLLAGSWCQSDGDQEAMRQLCRSDAEELNRRVSRWTNETDPPIRQVGTMWEWTLRRRAWPHLSRFIGPTDLTAFQTTVLSVLGETDPRIELPADQRWMASIHDRSPRYSDCLRQGLTAGLALLATEPSNIRCGIDLEGFVGSIVRRLFSDTPDPRRWYSLASILPTLAETSPEVLLDVIERDVIGNPAVRNQLFEEEGALGGGGRHCHLLWALERMAWEPLYLSRVSIILAALAEYEATTRSGNHPSRTLRGIFLSWHPNTRANVAQRMAAIDAMARQHEEIAFRLCLELLPRRPDVGEPHVMPQWRNWAEGHEQSVTNQEWWEAVKCAFDRLLVWAANDPMRWACLVDPIPEVTPEWIETLISGLEGLNPATCEEQHLDRLRQSIRHQLHLVRTIEGFRPDLTEQQLSRLEAVYHQLEPQCLVQRSAWLFSQRPDLLSITGSDSRRGRSCGAGAARRNRGIRPPRSSGQAFRPR